MKFLIIQTAFIGDVVLATPLIEKIKKHYPGADIDFLLRKGNETLFTAHPLLRSLLVWDKKGGKYRNLWLILKAIRSNNYDIVVNCQRFGASGLLTMFSGAKSTIGFDKNPFSRFFSHQVKHEYGTHEHPIHETDRNLKLIAHLTDGSRVAAKLYPSIEDEHAVADYQTTNPYICMAPTSVWFTKQWPAHKWVQLIGRFTDTHTIYLLGGPGDQAACDQIIAKVQSQKAINLAGKLSFLQSATLMKGAVMNYVNDSAPIHIATAVDAPVTAIFCSTIPAFGFTPLSSLSIVAETKETLACRPCGLHGRKSCPEKHFLCAEQIDVFSL